MLAPGQSQGVDNAFRRYGRPAGPLQLHVDEADVEARIVNDEHRVADELQEFINDLDETRLILQELVGDAVYGLRVRMDLPVFRIDEPMKLAARRDAIDELDAPNFDEPVACFPVEPGCLGIEHDFAQHAEGPPLPSGQS